MILPNNWNGNNAGNEKNDARATLTSSPAEITLSENMKAFFFEPVEVTGQSVNLATLAFVVWSYIGVGETVSFTFGGSTYSLEASATPTSGQFWTEATQPASVTATYLSAVAESIADTLLQILSFKTNYDLSANGANVYISAKIHGSEYDISGATTAGSSVFFAQTGGTEQFETQSVIDYSGYCDLYIGNEAFAAVVDRFKATKIDTYLIDSKTQTAEIAVNAVAAWVEPIRPVYLNTESNALYQMDKGTDGGGLVIPDEFPDDSPQRFVLRPYFLVYGDSYRFVENGQRKRIVKGITPVRWVQLGALHELRPYDMDNYVWMPDQNKAFSFMTATPQNKTVTYESHEFLQLICRKFNSSVTAYVEVTLKYYDGSIEVLNKPSFDASGLSGNISFDVSPVALGLADLEVLNGKLIDSYEIRLVWTTPAGIKSYSNGFNYVFDRECYRDKYQVIYLNEFGAWDSIEFRGAKQINVSRSVDVLKRAIPFNANTSEAVSAEVNIFTKIDTDDTHTIHSGLMSNAHHEHAKNILNSSSVYIWNPSLSKYESIGVYGYQYQHDTKSTAASISIDFRYTVSNNTINR